MILRMNNHCKYFNYYSILDCTPVKCKLCKYRPKETPILDETWKPFIDALNERFKK